MSSSKNKTVTVHVPYRQAALVQQLLDIAHRLEKLPEETQPEEFIDTCEQVIVEEGRELIRKLFEQSPQNGIDGEEKNDTIRQRSYGKSMNNVDFQMLRLSMALGQVPPTIVVESR